MGLSGSLSAVEPHRGGPSLVIVKFEDLVHRPVAVMHELERLGLPRNAVPFEPIEENIHDSCTGQGPCRANIASRDPKVQQLAEGDLLQRLREQLLPYRQIFDMLG